MVSINDSVKKRCWRVKDKSIFDTVLNSFNDKLIKYLKEGYVIEHDKLINELEIVRVSEDVNYILTLRVDNSFFNNGIYKFNLDRGIQYRLKNIKNKFKHVNK